MVSVDLPTTINKRWSSSGQSCSSLTQRGRWVHCVDARMQTNLIPHPLLSLLVQSFAQHSKESALKKLWYMGPLAHIQIILMSFNIQAHHGLGHCFRFSPSGQPALVNKLETHYFSPCNMYTYCLWPVRAPVKLHTLVGTFSAWWKFITELFKNM